MTTPAAVPTTAPGKVSNEARKSAGAQRKSVAPVVIRIEGNPSDEYMIVRSPNPIWRSSNGKARITNEQLFARGFRASSCVDLKWIKPTPETAKRQEAERRIKEG